MKTQLYTTLLAALLIAACKPKEKKEDDPKATAKVTLTPVHSINHYGNRSNTYYKGDTIRYDVVVSSQKDISSLNVTVNGASKISKTSFSNATSFTERLTYIIDANPAVSVEIKATVKESTDIETSNSISFIVSDLKEYQRLKIFNKASIDKADSTKWHLKYVTKTTSFSNFVEETLTPYFPGSNTQFTSIVLMQQSAYTFDPIDNSKIFYKRIAFPYASNNTGFTTRIIKANVAYESLTNPNQIVNYFNNNIGLDVGTISTSIRYLDPVAIGDVYVMYFDYQYAPSIENYFV
ncbi:MAG: hypothetical protein MUF42_15890 [Cytophagaceae bacterium]|nr:hypothetical protein [Cytophagaceae bacterium]